MKRYARMIPGMLLVLVLFVGCGLMHEHTWAEATCDAPRTCTECGETKGYAAGHNWTAATCVTPKICTSCAETEGSALGHIITEPTYNEEAVCPACGMVTGGKKTPGISFGIRDMVSGVYASSVYSGDDLGVHRPENLYDGRLDTNWTENAPGNGVGEYVVFYLDSVYAVNKLRICIGSHFNEWVYKENCRPKALTLTFSDGSTQYIRLEDTYDEQIITFDRFYYTDYIKITIEEVYTGTKYLDTVIAELNFVAYQP